MRYLIFDTQAGAIAADKNIFKAITTEYKSTGGKEDAQGLIGKVRGVDRPNSVRTTRWDEPRQGEDGKWCLLHPENYRLTERPGKHGLIAKMMKNLNSVPVEEYSDDWFAKFEEGEASDRPGNLGKAKGLAKK